MNKRLHKKQAKKAVCKTIAYEYLFNYFGGQEFKNKVITGASIILAFHPYKNGNEVKFHNEPHLKNGNYLCDCFIVSFDRENMYNIEPNPIVMAQFCEEFGWKSLSSEVTGYTLDQRTNLSTKEKEAIPEILRGFPVSAPMDVTEEEFLCFLRANIKDFDISDNMHAQVPSVSFI